FSGVLYLGCVAIIAAIDTLITPVNGDAYAHTANIAFIIVAPLILLSLIPVYPGKAVNGVPDDNQALLIEKRTGSPKFLEVLLSYIIIPLTVILTLVLLIYILLNIGGRFWTDNLLEPMLIAYSITVIIVTLLVSRLEKTPAGLFRRIFPKVLMPIALFQVIASMLLLKDTGVTYGRYFVILYGVFAVFSGAVLSLKPAGKSGVIALALVALSAVSLIPPVDAFSVSRNSQIASLEATLEKNGMLQSGVIMPDGSIPDEDKARIITSIRYLNETEELGTIPWLPSDFNGYDDAEFYETFGFYMYSTMLPGSAYVSVYLDRNSALPVGGYDVLMQVSVPVSNRPGVMESPFEISGMAYALITEASDEDTVLIVRDSSLGELIRFDTGKVFERYADYEPEKGFLTLEEAAFTEENENAALMVIVQNAGFTRTPGITDKNALLYVLIDVKKRA
ncbi:MAG: DUF4153 domain-containing protein, partial [Clostridiales bacterium]|nr:DUF4153 domain-containing protein [Clostridiales bacterium]